jgi:hypothetical protein
MRQKPRSGAYRARYIDPNGQDRSKSFSRKVDAEWFVATVESGKLQGTWTDPTRGKVTFAAWLETWWTTAADLRPSTRARDEAYFSSLVLPRFGGTPLAAIRQPDVQAWVAELSGRGFKPATVVKAYQLLGRTLTAAVNADMVARSPCRAVRLPKVEREEMRFLTPVEVARLADAIDPGYRALVLLGAYGGLRIGELAGLRRRWVDLLRGTVDVAEIVVEVRGKLSSDHPRPEPGGARWDSRVRSSRSWPRTSGRSARRMRMSSRPRRAACCARPTSGGRSGCRRCERPAWRRCARTTFGTPRWRCGSRPAPTPRRSASAPGTLRWRSRWTATAICSRDTTRSCATAWTPCWPKAARKPRRESWCSFGPSTRPGATAQRRPRTTQATTKARHDTGPHLRIYLVRRQGLEPRTVALRGHCSAN